MTRFNSEQADTDSVAVRYQFSALLAAISLLLIASGVLPYVTSSLNASAIELVSSVAIFLLFLGVLIAASIAVSPKVKTRRRAAAMAAIVVVLQLMNLISHTKTLTAIADLVSAAFLAFAIVMILQHLFHARDVGGETICASLCAYLLLGVLWAFLYSLVELVDPGSFRDVVEGTERFGFGLGGADTGRVLYFSFVTLATLGYGDIVPTQPLSRTLAAVEAVIGQLYLAVLVARLVGMHTAFMLQRPGGEREED